VLAAIPALLLPGAIPVSIGVGLETYLPWLVQMEIVIRPPR
jgi:hypothetical protein